MRWRADERCQRLHDARASPANAPTPYAITATMANSASNLLGVLPATQLSGVISNQNLPANPFVAGTIYASGFSGNTPAGTATLCFTNGILRLIR